MERYCFFLFLLLFFVISVYIYNLPDYFYLISFSSKYLDDGKIISNLRNINDISFIQNEECAHNCNEIGSDYSNIYENKSKPINLMCDSTISEVTTPRKEVQITYYHYTASPLSGNTSLIMHNGVFGNMLPANIFHQTGMKGDASKCAYSDNKYPNDLVTIQRISNSLSEPENHKVLDYKSQEAWEQLSVDYPQFILLESSKQKSPVELYRITDGDDLDVINPYIHANRSSNIELHDNIPLIISINASHIEGVDIDMELDKTNPTSVNWIPLNDSTKVYDNTKIKTFYFIPQVSKVLGCNKNDDRDLIIMFAVSSETSLYYSVNTSIKFC